LAAHLLFCNRTKQNKKSNRATTDKIQATNSTYLKGGVSYSKDPDISGWLIIRQNEFQIKFCGKSPALRVAAKRYKQP
jgi:hypothetical protein